MLSRKELVDVLAHLAAPLTPFTIEGAPDDDGAFLQWIEQRSQSRLMNILDEAVNAFVELINHPPELREYKPPARDESSFATEFLELAGLYGKTSYVSRIVEDVEHCLSGHTQRCWAIDVLGRLRNPLALDCLGRLAIQELSNQEKLCLVEAIAEFGGAQAREMLVEFRGRPANVAVVGAIDPLLKGLEG